MKELRELLESFIFVLLVGTAAFILGGFLGYGFKADILKNDIERCNVQKLDLNQCSEVQGWVWSK